MSASFEQLKEALLEDVCLSFPDYSEGASKLELFVDASSVGAGACLVLSQNGQYNTIGYAFMTFSPAHTRYSTIERELVAIRWGVQAFRAVVYGVPFLLYTDHKPLLHLHNIARDNSRLMCTMVDLAEFDFIIKYRPGKDNTAADTMSRVINAPVDSEDDPPADILPKRLSLIKSVEGSGDSLFISLHACLSEIEDPLSLMSLSS
jgi:hypothetical protein